MHAFLFKITHSKKTKQDLEKRFSPERHFEQYWNFRLLSFIVCLYKVCERERNGENHFGNYSFNPQSIHGQDLPFNLSENIPIVELEEFKITSTMKSCVLPQQILLCLYCIVVETCKSNTTLFRFKMLVLLHQLITPKSFL